MSGHFSAKFLSVLLAILFSGILVQGVAGTDLRVGTFPKELYPGQAVLIRVQVRSEAASVRAVLDNQKILLFADSSKRNWTGLAGLDLDIKPGEHLLSYRVRFADGCGVKGTKTLTVRKKEFPLERITVDEKYVHLSKQDLARYRRERKILSSIYRTQSEKRFWQQGFAVPVDVEKGSRFGLRRIVNGEPRSPHSGADLKAGAGTPVEAANNGRVVFAGDLFFSGNTLILDHGGGLYTIYAHLSEIMVGKSQEVRQGEIIGLVGATGRVTGPHLHWGAKLNGARVDPFSLVSLPIPPVQSRDHASTPVEDLDTR